MYCCQGRQLTINHMCHITRTNKSKQTADDRVIDKQYNSETNTIMHRGALWPRASHHPCVERQHQALSPRLFVVLGIHGAYLLTKGLQHRSQGDRIRVGHPGALTQACQEQEEKDWYIVCLQWWLSCRDFDPFFLSGTPTVEIQFYRKPLLNVEYIMTQPPI